MKNFVMLLGVLGSFMLLSCKSSTAPTNEQGENIPYAVVRGYFVKNDADLNLLKDGKITSEKDFSALFGAATVMGEDGKPTVIDFTKQYVIAVVADQTDSAVVLNPLKLEKSGDNLTFTYEYKVGEKQSYTIKPLLIVVVDSKYEGNLQIKKAE